MSRAPWQLERAKRRGNKRMRQLAFDFLAPGYYGRKPISAESAATSGGNVAGLPPLPTQDKGKPAAGSITANGVEDECKQSKTKGF